MHRILDTYYENIVLLLLRNPKIIPIRTYKIDSGQFNKNSLFNLVEFYNIY